MKFERGRAKFTAQEQWMMCVILCPSSVVRSSPCVERSVETGVIFGDEERVGNPRDERLVERRS